MYEEDNDENISWTNLTAYTGYTICTDPYFKIDAKTILEQLDIKDIEKYLREKKLKKLKK